MTKSEREMRARLVARLTAAPAEDLVPVGVTFTVTAETAAHATNIARKSLSKTRADAYITPLLHIEPIVFFNDESVMWEVVLQTGWQEEIRS